MADNEISLNIEETNKLRLSLGLKPLKLTSDEPSGPTPQELARDKKIEQDKLAADLKARIASHRTKRQHEAFMAVKALGEADNDETDDLRSWVSSSRVKAAQFKSEQGAKKAEEEEARLAELRRRAMSDSDDDEGKYSSKDLAGLKVKHDANEIIEGETVILTLADKHILTAKGTIDEENDELENVLKAEHKKREKAMEASGKKAKPLWEEDGKKRNILDKYDEQEEEAMLIDAAGGVAMEKARRQEEMRKKLDAGNKILDSASAAAKAVGDYYTEGELAAMKPVAGEKKKKKKERKIRTKKVEEEDTADVIKALEEEAAAKEKAGLDDGTYAELGTRSERKATMEAKVKAEQKAAEEKRARFDRAVDKANWASLALKNQPKEMAPGEEEVYGDEVDNELYESLARARRQVQVKTEDETKPSLDNIAASAAVKREEDETALKEDLKSGLAFTETSEFVRNIQAAKAKDLPGSKAQTDAKAEDLDVYMDVDKDDVKVEDVKSEPESEEDMGGNPQGRWVAAEGEGGGRAGRGGRQIRKRDRDGDEDEDEAGSSKGHGDNVVNEASMGRGLAGVLGLLKDKGEFTKDRIVWAGRNHDKSKVALQGLGDTYTGGAHEEHYARSIETALTKKDEFGRILTPKERFRDLCYQFHGIQPSKNKQAKRLKKAAEEIAMHKVATSEFNKDVEKMMAVHKMTALPYIPLSGKDAAKSLQAAAASSNLGKPAKGSGKGEGKGKYLGHLGGGQTPLLGDRKVEAMLGVRKG